MFRIAVVAVLAVMMATIVNAQDYCPHDMPPATVVIEGVQLQRPGVRAFGGGGDVYLRRVTDGIAINWLTKPEWALDAAPDDILYWEEGYQAYCRHLSSGTDRTRLDWCKTECIAWHGALYYQVAEWTARGWSTTVFEILVVRESVPSIP